MAKAGVALQLQSYQIRIQFSACTVSTYGIRFQCYRLASFQLGFQQKNPSSSFLSPDCHQFGKVSSARCLTRSTSSASSSCFLRISTKRGWVSYQQRHTTRPTHPTSHAFSHHSTCFGLLVSPINAKLHLFPAHGRMGDDKTIPHRSYLYRFQRFIWASEILDPAKLPEVSSKDKGCSNHTSRHASCVLLTRLDILVRQSCHKLKSI